MVLSGTTGGSWFGNKNTNPVLSKTGTTMTFFSGVTLAGGYSYESDERIKRRKRIQKLERILDEKEFNEIVSKSEYDDIMIEKKDVYQDGLIAVKPMSGPIGTLYMDFKYGETEAEKAEKKRKERENKFDRIFKKSKQGKCRRKNSKKK